MPIRQKPGRPKIDEPPAPQRQRTLRFPVEIDQALVQKACELGVSPQAAIREAVVEWLQRRQEPEPPG